MTARTAEATAALGHSLGLLARARRCGLVCSVLFGLAALAVADGLQMLMRHDFNKLDIIPGETVALSGAMPLGAESHTQLVFTFEGAPGLRFTPLESFKGFWFGGLMWRGEVVAAADAEPGRAVLTIIDRVPAKKVASAATGRNGSQASTAGATSGSSPETAVPAPSEAAPDSTTVQNPMLVHQIDIHPDAAARRAEDPSIISRFLNIPPFAVAGFFAVCAFAACGAHWFLFGRAEKALAALGLFFIHGVKPDTQGSLAAFAHSGKADFTPGDRVRLLDASGRSLGNGVIRAKDRHKGFALFPPTNRTPLYGGLVALEREETTHPAA